MADRVSCALVELVMVFQLFDVFGAAHGFMRVSEVTICDRLEATVCLDWFQGVASRCFAIHRVECLHLGQMVLNALVVVLHPGWLLLVRLDIVDEILLSAASRIIIVGNPVVPLVHAKFNRGVNQLALELGLLRRKDHLFAILIWLELGDLARVVGRALGELHADAGGHEHFLVCSAGHEHLFVRQLAFIIKVVAKTASYRVSTRIGLVGLSK